MKITVSGKKKEHSEGLTVKQLIEAEDVENPLYVTVTLNDEFVNSEDFDKTVINDGDNIEFLYFMGGGC
ncbi:MAG: sulfur carrier protein ThiS [Eubacterium sp.]|nr:sulfur carrier protein ThiS [Eubacterium sp.]MBR1532002.1 sulfur carrier protein ThiS [Eubacterium sp.]MBR1762260.1 sulfur carrier protein ThiS [Eubacterium sp.]